MKLGAEVRTQFSIEEEDDLLQFAIQQSLLEAGSERDEVRSCLYDFLSVIFLINKWLLCKGRYMGGIESAKAI